MFGLPPTYWYLWTGTLINRLGSFVFIFLALYLTKERGFSVEEAGLVVSLYGAGSIASGPVGGFFADRIGRRKTMVCAMVLAAVAMLQLGLARGPLHIALSTFLLGFCGDSYRPAVQATVADLVAPADRARAYGYLYWAVNLGFAGAAILAGFLSKQSFFLLFAADAATTLVCGLIVFLRVPETHGREVRGPHQSGGFLAPYRDPVFLSFMVTQFLNALVFQQANVALPIDMRAHGVPPAMYGSLIAINGVLIVFVQPLALRQVHRFRRSHLLAVGSLLVGFGFGINGLAATPLVYAASIVVWTLGEIVVFLAAPGVIADLSPQSLRGSYQGAYQMTWSAAALFAPLLGSLVLGRLGGRALWTGCLALGALAAVLHLLIAGARHTRLLALGTDPHARRE